MVLLEFSIFPLGKGESVAPYVARCLEVIDRSGIDYQCHAMGTVLEGDYDAVMGVVHQCFEELAKDCPRIECNMKLDYRHGRQGELRAKVARLEQQLGRSVRK